MRNWYCKIGGFISDDIPAGADGPMRDAVQSAFLDVTGSHADWTFSGWGATLEERELAVIENRDPIYEKVAAEAPWMLKERTAALEAELASALEDLNREVEVGNAYMEENTRFREEISVLQGMREEVLHYQREFHQLRDKLAAAQARLAACGGENCMGQRVEGAATWVRAERLAEAKKQGMLKAAGICESIEDDGGEWDIQQQCANAIRQAAERGV